MAYRIAFGPETDVTVGKAVVGQFGNDWLAVKVSPDFIAFALDGEFVPGAGRDFDLGADRSAAFAVDQFKEAEGAAFGAGADVIVIALVLVAEDHAGHLFDCTRHAFQAGGEGKVAERLVGVDEHWIMFVGGVAGELGENGLLRKRRVWIEVRDGAGDFVLDDAPGAGFAFAGDGAVEASETVRRGEVEEEFGGPGPGGQGNRIRKVAKRFIKIKRGECINTRLAG